MRNLLLFDLDGTLLRTQGAGIRAMEAAGREIFGENFSLQGVSVAGGLDPQLFLEAATRSGVSEPAAQHGMFRDLYLERLEAELKDRRKDLVVLPGVISLLLAVRASPHTILGLVTGNYRKAGPIKLLACDIDPSWFSVCAYGDEAESRPEMVRLAISRSEESRPSPEEGLRVVVIGDTPRDIAAARRTGADCLAVATGRFALADLVAAARDLSSMHIEVEELTDAAVMPFLLPAPRGSARE